MKNSIASIFNSTVVILVITLVFFSCKRGEDLVKAEIPKSSDSKLYNVLLKAGIKADNIKDVGEYYVVEGDMRFKKNKTDLKKVSSYFRNSTEKLTNMYSESGKGKLATAKRSNSISQWHTPEIISSLNVERIYISSSISYNYIITHSAFQNWSNIENCKINFYGYGARPVGNDNSIIVFADNSMNAYAQAEFPSLDEAGFQIRVNENLFSTLNDAQKIYILTHEIGHCLGLRHSDLLLNGEGSSGAVQVPGTPTTDHYSIMNSGGYHPIVPSFVSMTQYDKMAAQYLYPYNQYDNWITYPSYKYPDIELRVIDFNQLVDIRWDKNLVQTNTVTIELYQYNQLVQVIGQNIPNSGLYSYPIHLYTTQEGLYMFDLHLKIIADNNPGIYDYSPLFRSWWID